MDNLPEMAVIGEAAVIKVFQAVGYACYDETDPTAVIERCEKLAAAGTKIILILEKTAQQIASYLDSRAGIPYPIILPIPDTISNGHYGLTRLQQNMEKAMGMKVGGNL